MWNNEQFNRKYEQMPNINFQVSTFKYNPLTPGHVSSSDRLTSNKQTNKQTNVHKTQIN